MPINTVQEAEIGSPFFIEGLPGVGLVGQIVVDHIDEALGMSHHATVDCGGFPQVAVFEEGRHSIKPPVRIHADGRTDLAVLKSDVPVSPGANELTDCVLGWVEKSDATPIFVSGLPQKPGDVPSLYGVSSGGGNEVLDDTEPPEESGTVSRPTGTLLGEAEGRGIDAVGLIVESDPRFPDPAAARTVIEDGIESMTGAELDTSELVERSEEITDKKEKFAKSLQAGNEEGSTTTHTGMYH